MALPTAQLGAMSGINMPSFVPVQQIEKHPKAWQQALLSIIANAGSNVLQQGIQNSMAPDYAPEPASGFSKFWNGPTINQARATELDRQSMDQQKLDDNNSNERMARMLAATGQNKDRIAATQRLNAEMSGQLSQLEHNRAGEDLASAEATSTAGHQKIQDLIAQITATKQGQLVDRQSKLVDAQIPDIQSQTRERNATAGAKEMQTKLMQQYAPKDPTAAVVNPNIAKFANQTPAPVATDPETDAVIKLLSSRLAQPAGGPTPQNFPETDEQAFARQQALQRIFGSL